MVEKKEAKETKKIGEGLGISGFTLGVLAILFAGYAGLIISIIGAAFCLVQQRKNKTGLGKAGLIVNIIAFLLSIAMIYWIAPMMGDILNTALTTTG